MLNTEVFQQIKFVVKRCFVFNLLIRLLGVQEYSKFPYSITLKLIEEILQQNVLNFALHHHRQENFVVI